jgi:hypothetical protein
MSTWTLVIMLLGSMGGISGGMTTVPGFSSRDTCQEQAAQIQQVQVDRGARRIVAMCVEVR